MRLILSPRCLLLWQCQYPLSNQERLQPKRTLWSEIAKLFCIETSSPYFFCHHSTKTFILRVAITRVSFYWSDQLGGFTFNGIALGSFIHFFIVQNFLTLIGPVSSKAAFLIYASFWEALTWLTGVKAAMALIAIIGWNWCIPAFLLCQGNLFDWLLKWMYLLVKKSGHA